MRKFVALILPLFFVANACNQKTPEDVTPAQAKELMGKEDVVVLDVRTPEEWDNGHIEGARHINFYDDNFKDEVAELPKDKEYVVYCYSGGRSAKAVHLMKEEGFKNLHNLEGGIKGWTDAGNDTVQ